jgi:hypothetical protein
MFACPLTCASSHQTLEDLAKPVSINTMPVEDITKQGIELTKSEQFLNSLIRS